MAQKRMFDKTITNADDFLEMPDSSQNLYFHLSMNADDDGFINNWKSIMRMTGHKDDDLKVLIAKNFIIPFDTGVIVIKHWRINNYLRRDRYVETKFKDEKNNLFLDNNLVYQLDTTGEHSIDKNRLDYIEEDNSKRFELIEKNLCRTLSPIEIEIIKKWDYDDEVIELAIKEAILRNAKTIKYIDRVIFNWKQNKVETVEDAKKYIEEFSNKVKPKNKKETKAENYYKEL